MISNLCSSLLNRQSLENFTTILLYISLEDETLEAFLFPLMSLVLEHLSLQRQHSVVAVVGLIGMAAGLVQ